MSKHWNPQETLAPRSDRPRNRGWPQGATAGLLMVAGACLGLAALLYRIAGPRDLFVP